MSLTYQNLKVVTSGAPSFYDWTRFATVTDDNVNLASSITASFNTDGTVSFTTSAGDSQTNDISHWHDGGTVAGIGNSRWAKKTSSGDPTTGTLTSTLVDITAARTMSIQTVAGEARVGVELIEIFSDSGGTVKVGQISFTISATV